MSLPETHDITLRFRIDGDAPKAYVKRWIDLKHKCESSNNKQIILEWLQHCKLESVRNLPYLERAEGGIGRDDNSKNKQIRFRRKQTLSLYIDNDIVLDQVISTNEEKWTFEELDDLIIGFRLYANEWVHEECIKGYIEMVHKNSSNDNYLLDKTAE
jgi:hypothetical protein